MDFTKEEYQRRLKKVQKMMQEKGIELLISHDTNNLNYLTGYDAWSFYYAQCAIVHVNADEPLCFVRAQDSGGAYIKTYLKDENIIVYDEGYVHKESSIDYLDDDNGVLLTDFPKTTLEQGNYLILIILLPTSIYPEDNISALTPLLLISFLTKLGELSFFCK